MRKVQLLVRALYKALINQNKKQYFNPISKQSQFLRSRIEKHWLACESQKMARSRMPIALASFHITGTFITLIWGEAGSKNLGTFGYVRDG